MSRIGQFAGWLVAAIASTVLVWVVIVYALDRFDRGYGRDTWFALQLYVSGIAIVIGLVGYVVVTLFRSAHGTFGAACIAGAAFAAGQLLFAFGLTRAFPDWDVAGYGFAGALAIGALSVLASRFDAT